MALRGSGIIDALIGSSVLDYGPIGTPFVPVSSSEGRDAVYGDLTINNLVSVRSNGFKTFVLGTMTVNSGGIWHNDGNPGVLQAAGAGLTLNGRPLRGSGGGATGGAASGGTGASASAPDGGQFFGGGGGGGAGAGAAGGNGAISGGSGGGGAAPGGTGNPGATQTEPNAQANYSTFGGINGLMQLLTACQYGQCSGSSLSIVPMGGGLGGGGGGGGGPGSTGGGGGGGGGVMVLIVNRLVINTGGRISVNGGAGGAGVLSSPAGGGGGGGGGGGLLLIGYGSIEGTLGAAGLQANGGAGGVSGSFGPGGNGGAGRIMTFQL